ncbi:MAG: hypothetical protein JHC95_11910 [Solirubrobacteraceae bacterium]|nr:hypothetical protein [Solirubrobacteraceae bacterium]
MFATTVTRPVRLMLAVLAIAMAAAAVPAVSGAAQNTGSGPAGNSELCNTLRDRMQRYHDISTDPTQPKNVRDFYKYRARNTLDRARAAGCGWAAVQAKQQTTGGGRVPQATVSVSAIKATTTGNQQQDEYCAGVAKLIQDAWDQGDRQIGLGNDAEAQAWYDLAEDFIDRATQNGCRFTALMKSRHLRVPAATALAQPRR